jgi:uncharacterized protein (DUF433 family)
VIICGEARDNENAKSDPPLALTHGRAFRYHEPMTIALPTEHPHVARDEQGRPRVGSARLQLHILAEYWRLGWSLDELAAGYPFLTMAEILDALSYYLDHRDEVETLIRANRPPEQTAADGG